MRLTPVHTRLLAIWNRLKWVRHFRAMHAMLLTALLCLALALFIRTPWLQGFDLRVTKEVQEHPHFTLDFLFTALTFAGNSTTLIAVAVAGAVALYARKLPRASLFALLSLLALPLDMLIKDVVERARPNSEIVRVLLPAGGYSFPSGHSMGSAGVYWMLAYLCFVHVGKQRRRMPLVILFAAIPFGVALARIYVGAHWLSDVCAGLSAGGFVVLLLTRFYTAPAHQEATHAEHPLDGTLSGNVPASSAHRQPGA